MPIRGMCRKGMLIKVSVLGCNVPECEQPSLWKGTVVMKLNLETYLATSDLPNGPVYIWEMDDAYLEADFHDDDQPASLGQKIGFGLTVVLVAAVMIWMATLIS